VVYLRGHQKRQYYTCSQEHQQPHISEHTVGPFCNNSKIRGYTCYFWSLYTNIQEEHKKYPLWLFTALHGMQTRSSDENSVCPSVRPSARPSVRPSVTRVDCDKTAETSVQIYIPYERTFSLVF